MSKLVHVNHVMGNDVYVAEDKVMINRNKKGQFINVKKLLCTKCGKAPTKDGQDPCISNLPGIAYGCCGHGKEGYLMFEDGTMIMGDFKIERNW